MVTPRHDSYRSGMDQDLAARLEALEKETWKRHQLLLEALADRFEAMDRKFDQKWEQFGRHFETMEKAALERHDQLLEVMHTRFDNHERRIRKLEGRG